MRSVAAALSGQERLVYRRSDAVPGVEELLVYRSSRLWRVFHESYSVSTGPGTSTAIIEQCISNRHHGCKKGGRSEPVTKERSRRGRRRAFRLTCSRVVMSSSRVSGRPFASAALQWFHTRSSGLSSGA